MAENIWVSLGVLTQPPTSRVIAPFIISRGTHFVSPKGFGESWMKLVKI